VPDAKHSLLRPSIARGHRELEWPNRMTYAGRKVRCAFFNRLAKECNHEELLELAAVISHENFRSKLNSVFGVESGESYALSSVWGRLPERQHLFTKVRRLSSWPLRPIIPAP
jgi:hypothetical protein